MLQEIKHEQSRKDLINLIKTLPDNEIPAVKKFVEFVIHEKKEQTLEEFLANVPEEEEEISEEFKKKLKKLSKETKKEFKEGKTISLNQLKKQYGL